MPVDLICGIVSARKYARAFRADANSLLQILALDQCELSLMLVSDSAIRRLNRDFRAKDKPTDVLSFPQLDESGEVPSSAKSIATEVSTCLLGDVVISIDTARRQARELDQSIAHRIRTLLIHGLLHLLGYDHERSKAEAHRMFARERQLALMLDRPH